MGRLDRLRKYRDPNFVNSHIDTGLVCSEDEGRSNKKFYQTVGARRATEKPRKSRNTALTTAGHSARPSRNQGSLESITANQHQQTY